jgi:membrane-associated phospholipid phosphatase
VITRWWKISVHAAVAGGAVVMLAFVYGPWMLSLALLAALVCWARVEVEDHTPAQVTLGVLVGPVVGGATFFAML